MVAETREIIDRAQQRIHDINHDYDLLIHHQSTDAQFSFPVQAMDLVDDLRAAYLSHHQDQNQERSNLPPTFASAKTVERLLKVLHSPLVTTPFTKGYFRRSEADIRDWERREVRLPDGRARQWSHVRLARSHRDDFSRLILDSLITLESLVFNLAGLKEDLDMLDDVLVMMLSELPILKAASTTKLGPDAVSWQGQRQRQQLDRCDSAAFWETVQVQMLQELGYDKNDFGPKDLDHLSGQVIKFAHPLLANLHWKASLDVVLHWYSSHLEDETVGTATLNFASNGDSSPVSSCFSRFTALPAQFMAIEASTRAAALASSSRGFHHHGQGVQDRDAGFLGLMERDETTGGWTCPQRFSMCFPAAEVAVAKLDGVKAWLRQLGWASRESSKDV